MKIQKSKICLLKILLECPMNVWFQLSQKCLPDNNDCFLMFTSKKRKAHAKLCRRTL